MTSIGQTLVLGNILTWNARNRERYSHEPLENEQPADEESPLETADEEANVEPELSSSDEPAVAPDAAEVSDTASVETVALDEETGAQAADEEAEEDTAIVPPSDTADTDVRARRTVSLAELEEERELAQRRTSACILLAVFVLFRLWIEALMEGDFGLLLLCLVGTSWTARFIRANREREEELDRRIAAYIENSNGTDDARTDLRVLSFQAQLALAIMESQRAMGQGGFGHPDGTHGAHRGVSDQAKEHWKHFEHKANGLPTSKNKGGYGSVAQEDAKEASEDDVAHCSICLCEYEDGERLVQLPCSHVYHDECVSSWTSNNVRCPLCNFDLEAVSSDDLASSSLPEDSIV